jgi:hypothetical protein
MVNISADNADTMVDDEPTMLPEHGQEMCEHTLWPQPLVPAPRPQCPEPPPRPRTAETHTLSGQEFLRLLTSQKPRPVAPTLQAAETARNTSDVDVEQQVLSESAGSDSVNNGLPPDVSLPDVPLRDVPLPKVPLPKVPLPKVPLPKVPLPKVPLPKSLSPKSLSLMSLSLRRTQMAR